MPKSRNHFPRRALLSMLLLLSSLPAPQLCLAQADDKADDKTTGDKSKAKKTSGHHEAPYALIFGTVWAPDNRPVYGVKIKCRRSDQKKPHWELYSDHAGEFAFRVPAGKADYLISADLKDYKPLDKKHFQTPPEVTVHIENDERTDIGVHLK
jgi:hypothetical protein